MRNWIGVDLCRKVVSREEIFLAYPWLTVEWQEVPPDADFFLTWSEDGLHLNASKFNPRSSIHIDFISGPQARRIRTVKGETLTRAIGCHKGLRPAVIDATAGLGGDMSVLANIGCFVNAFERDPVIAALLADALRRTKDVSATWAERVVLHHDNATHHLSRINHGVIYLDPMFVKERKSASGIALQIFHTLSETIEGQDALFEAAMDSACGRLVVKRPMKAPPLAGCKPATQIKGKTVRFDLYTKHKLTESDCEPHEVKRCQ